MCGVEAVFSRLFFFFCQIQTLLKAQGKAFEEMWATSNLSDLMVSVYASM